MIAVLQSKLPITSSKSTKTVEYVCEAFFEDNLHYVHCANVGAGLVPPNALVLRASLDIQVRCGTDTEPPRCECTSDIVVPDAAAQQCVQVRCPSRA